MKYPTSLDIRAEDGRLYGTDEYDQDWLIRWCGNGQYSHWVLSPPGDPDGRGFYVYAYDKRGIVEQIRAAEHRHKIYS